MKLQESDLTQWSKSVNFHIWKTNKIIDHWLFLYPIILNFNIIFEFSSLAKLVGLEIFPELRANLRSENPLVPGCLDKRGLSVLPIKTHIRTKIEHCRKISKLDSTIYLSRYLLFEHNSMYHGLWQHLRAIFPWNQ